MRRGQVGLLLAVTSGLFSVLLAVAVNVATGGTLPGALGAVAWLAWPAIGLLGVIGVVLAVWQQRLAVPAEAAPPRPAAPAELPTAPELFGRAEVRAEVERLVGRPGTVVVIAAAPGAGKTALALRVAHDVRARYPDGQLHASLLGGSAEPARPEAVLARFLAALGRPAEEQRGGADELAARFRSAVADLALLVVLDDARNAAQVTPLLPGGARCAAIVTSRSPLAELPGARLVGLGALDDAAGLELLADAAGPERVAADPEGARALLAACGGLPLAVRIVGGRLRARAGWTPAQLAARLADERRRLDELRQGDLAVRATFRAAYDGLSEADRAVFRRAGSHPAESFGPDAAAARAGVPPAEATAALERLADAYLIESPEPDRYRIHDLLRLFAGETLRDAGEGAATAARLMAHLGANPADLAGLPAVLREGLDAGLREEVIALVDAAGARQGDPFDRLAAWQAQAEATGAEGGRRRARALRWVSHSYTYLGQVRLALPPAQEALAVAEAAGDRWEIAQTARRHGEALRDLDRFAESEAALRRALELFAELGEVNEEVEVRAALGVLYNIGDRHHLTVPLLERALALLPADADNSRRGWVLACLAGAHRAAGDLDAARALAAETAALARRIGDRYLLGYCHQDAGWVAVGDGDLDAAEAEFAAMLRIFRDIGVASGAASARAALGVVADRRGDLDAAQAAFGAAEEEFRRLGDEIRAEQWRGHRAEILQRMAQGA